MNNRLAIKKSTTFTVKNDHFHITGEIGFNNVMAVYKLSLPYLNKHTSYHFDFSAVTCRDSSALALIIEWIKIARRQLKQVTFHHMSQELLTIAKAADIDGFVFNMSASSNSTAV